MSIVKQKETKTKTCDDHEIYNKYCYECAKLQDVTGAKLGSATSGVIYCKTIITPKNILTNSLKKKGYRFDGGLKLWYIPKSLFTKEVYDATKKIGSYELPYLESRVVEEMDSKRKVDKNVAYIPYKQFMEGRRRSDDDENAYWEKQFYLMENFMTEPESPKDEGPCENVRIKGFAF